MANTTNVNRERSRGFRGLLAIGAGVALLLGGGTFALWSASDSAKGGTITAGDLNLKVGTATYWDVSSDRTDATGVVAGTDGVAGHSITNMDTWRIVPGDTIAMAVPFDVDLVGDNLVAALDLVNPDQWKSANGITYTYELYGLLEGGSGPTELLSGARPLPPADDSEPAPDPEPLAYFQASATGQEAGQSDEDLPVLNPAADNLTVVVYATFDGKTANRDNATVKTTMSDIGLTLTQVRDAGTGIFK